MAMVINSNIQSLNAQRHLNSSLSAQNTATERLSSGLRINSAADDAAGLAIANRMTSQVKGLDMAIRNANDGVSLIQTAEGALGETTNILQRMRELSIQSANGIYDSGNRGTLNAEVQQLKAEIDRIAETTTFNGLNILDGSLGTVGLQIGEKANQTIDLDIEAMDTKNLGSGTTDADIVGAQTRLHEFGSLAASSDTDVSRTLNVNDVMINGQSIVKTDLNLGDTTVTTQDLVDSINDNVKGVTASTVVENVATNVGDGFLSGTDKVTIVVAGLDETINKIEVINTVNLQEMVDQINDKAGGLVAASINEDGKLVVSGENLASIGIKDNSTNFEATGIVSTADYNTTAGAIANTTENGAAIDARLIAAGVSAAGEDDIAVATATIALKSDDPITIERGTTGSLQDLENLGFRETTKAGTIEGNEIAVAAAWDQGDLTINGVEIGKSDSGSLEDKIAAINLQTSETGVTADVFSSLAILETAVGTPLDVKAGTFELNGVEITTTAGDLTATLASINAETADTGITARLIKDGFVLEGNVSAINLAAGTVAAGVAFTDGSTSTASQQSSGAKSAFAGDTTAVGGIKLSDEDGEAISVVNKDGLAATVTGLLDANASSGALSSSLESVDISTAAGANKAIEILDNAIQTISDVRGELGAVTNRLDYTISNLANVSENASAAKSRIMDADFAAESANLSRAQVLQQAGNAMLAQANSRPQQVLSLLQ